MAIAAGHDAAMSAGRVRAHLDQRGAGGSVDVVLPPRPGRPVGIVSATDGDDVAAVEAALRELPGVVEVERGDLTVRYWTSGAAGLCE